MTDLFLSKKAVLWKQTLQTLLSGYAMLTKQRYVHKVCFTDMEQSRINGKKTVNKHGKNTETSKKTHRFG